MTTDQMSRIFIDDRIESYSEYFPDGWMAKASEESQPANFLNKLVLDLFLAWRTISYTASMPALVVKSMQAATLGYASYVSPDASIIAFGEGVLAKLSRRIPELVEDRRLRSILSAEIVNLAVEFRTARIATTPELPVEPVWRHSISNPAFVMSVWSSQRVSYLSFYNAYEAFLTQCASRAYEEGRVRANTTEFKKVLRTEFGIDISLPCWTHPELNNARLVRHALSHANGRETPDLKKQNHGITLVDDVLQIIPEDNKKLLTILRSAVDTLIDAAKDHHKFAT